MTKKLVVIHSRVGHPLETVEIDNTLPEVQRLVGGYIEHVSLPHRLSLICNEEGNLLALPLAAIVTVPGPPPFGVMRHLIHGNFFICRSEDCEFASVQDGDMDLVRQMVLSVCG